MYIGDALLDFGGGHKIRRKAKPGYYIYHSLPASHQAIFFPTAALKKYPYDLQYHVSSDYALAARLYKAGYPFRRLTDWYLNFRWAACQPRIIWNYVRMQKTYSEKYYVCQGFGRNYPILLRLKTTGKTKARYNKV